MPSAFERKTVPRHDAWLDESVRNTGLHPAQLREQLESLTVDQIRRDGHRFVRSSLYMILGELSFAVRLGRAHCWMTLPPRYQSLAADIVHALRQLGCDSEYSQDGTLTVRLMPPEEEVKMQGRILDRSPEPEAPEVA